MALAEGADVEEGQSLVALEELEARDLAYTQSGWSAMPRNRLVFLPRLTTNNPAYALSRSRCGGTRMGYP